MNRNWETGKREDSKNQSRPKSTNNVAKEKKKRENEKILENFEPLDKITYVEHARHVIETLYDANKMITTTKIRSILCMLSELQKRDIKNLDQQLSKEFQSDLQYYKMRCVYEAGRGEDVKYFMEQSKLIGLIDWIGASRNNFQLYCHYVEALVAFHKYYGGKD